MSNFYSLNRLFADLAEKYPQAIAISTPSWPDLTFQGLYELIVKTHRQLRQLGIGRGDRVVLIAPANSSETATLSLAIAASATLIPIDPSLSKSELNNRLEQLNPKFIIKLSNFLLPTPLFDVPKSLATQVLDREISIPTLQASYHRQKAMGTFQFNGKTLFPPSQDDWAAPADDAFIIMTSGSTGSPKLVRMTQDALCYSCLEASQVLQLSTRDVCLNTLALFHVHGLITNFILPLLAGGKVALYGSFQPDYFLDWLVDSQATWYSVGPTIHLAILKAISEHPLKAKNHALRFMRSGSAPSNPQVITALEQHFGVPLIQGYGMSEIPLFTSTILPSNLTKERSQGYAKISKDSELAIANESGEIVPHGTVGEIIARGRNVMKNYLDNPVANRVAFREGWFRTGDLGWLDECGYLHLAGRLKEMINRGGNKVLPQEVDDVLMQFSEVEEVATFAVAHPRLGEDLVAAIVPKPGANITEHNLRTLLLERIADFKIPSQILFVDSIPKGKTGKIQRNKLAEEFAERLKFTYASPRNELEVKIASLFAQILDLEKIGIHDNFFLLGGDSLTGTQIIARICEIFAINIPIVTLFHHQTVAELATVVEQAVNCQTKQFHAWQSLIQIKHGRATKDPLFLIHDVAGSVLFYRQLANHLRSDRAVYVIQAQGLDGRKAPITCVSEMAANYIKEIRQVQPMGPYYIGGYSFGGVVAFEIARQLEAQGQEIKLLAIVDTPAPVSFEPNLPQVDPCPQGLSKILPRLTKLWSLNSQQRKDYIRYGLMNHCMFGKLRTPYRFYLRYIKRANLELGTIDVCWINTQARNSYVVKSTYSGKVALFCSDNMLLESANNPDLNWDKIATGGADIYSIPGSNHSTIIQEPLVRILADRLMLALAD